MAALGFVVVVGFGEVVAGVVVAGAVLTGAVVVVGTGRITNAFSPGRTSPKLSRAIRSISASLFSFLSSVASLAFSDRRSSSCARVRFVSHLDFHQLLRTARFGARSADGQPRCFAIGRGEAASLSAV